VCIEDIAHALSQKCRFTGHTKRFYSVGEHSWRASLNVAPGFELAALLHDATEAYLPDIASPVKRFVRVETPRGLKTFHEVEDHLATVIFNALGLSAHRPLIDTEAVKTVDLQMLATEVRDVMGANTVGGEWKLTHAPLAARIPAYTSSPAAMRELFLKRYYELI
jgi:hypothetical protein